MSARLIRIGYWGDGTPGDYPDPRALIDYDVDSLERETVVDYLARGIAARPYLGVASCRICGMPLGSLELSDGTYLWPEGLAHYVGEHRVRLPTAFVDHVNARVTELEEAQADDDWWRAAHVHR
jgi:hypothetical protein